MQLTAPLAIGPSDDAVDAGSRSRRHVQQRCEPLLGRDRPEVAAVDAALVDLARRCQPRCDLQRAVPSRGSVDRRPGVRLLSGQSERVKHEHGPQPATACRGNGEQVGLDRRGDRRALPLEQGGHRKARRLPRLGRTKGDQRVPLLCPQQPRSAASEDEPGAALRTRGSPERSKIGRPRPPRTAIGPRANTRRCDRAAGEQRCRRARRREQEQRCVEPERAWQPRAHARRPRRRGIREPCRKPDQHARKLPAGDGGPAAPEQRASQPAPQPQQRTDSHHASDGRDHRRVGQSGCAGRAHPRITASFVRRIPVSVLVSFASSFER